MIVLFFAIYIFVIIAAITTVVKSVRNRQTISSDGHRVPKSQDLTCDTKHAHKHEAPELPRYIVHEEPEEGYVVLNGVKRRIKDCKYL